MADTTNKSTKVSGLVTSLYDWIGAAVMALVVVSLLMSTFCRVVNVSGESMTHTLQPNERLLLTSVCAYPEYGDIVVICRENDTPLIKRVVGLPGDKIFINDDLGKVFRNGVELDEPYVRGVTRDLYHDGAITVPEGSIYVLGDNRENSLDSRSPAVECVALSKVVGVVTYRLSPFESLRNGE